MMTQKDVQQSIQPSSEDDGMQRRPTVGADSTRGENQEPPPLELRRGLSGAEAVAASDKGLAGVGRRVSSAASSEEQEALALLKGSVNFISM